VQYRLATALAILLAAPAARLDAQGATIRGHVVRADLPIGLAEAHLELRPSGATTRTDARGLFVFRGVPAGQVQLAVHRVGFAPAVLVLQVDTLAVTQVDIPLEPVGYHPGPDRDIGHTGRAKPQQRGGSGVGGGHREHFVAAGPWG